MSCFTEFIAHRVHGRRLAIVGVGNRLRGDDGVGPQVIDRIHAVPGTWVLDAGTVPENYLGVLLDLAPDVVLFIDAAQHEAPPGTWCVAPLDELSRRGESTHAPSLAPLGMLLESAGIECWLLGIQSASTRVWAPLDPAVAAGADAVAEVLNEVLAHEASHA